MSGLLSRLAAQGAHISHLTADSREVTAGSLFLAYPGEHADGRRYIAQAISRGAAAVVLEAEAPVFADMQWQIPHLTIEGLRMQAGSIADEFYSHPSRNMLMIGVTGTNGKTSCSHWLGQALEALGHKAAVIGTLGNGLVGSQGGVLAEAINTTPDPILLHGMLAGYLSQGATAVAMEVSSHGLQQGRVNGTHFDIALFTNLSRDHLDYHGDMQSYGAAKRTLFDWEGLRWAVLNSDDAFGVSMAADLGKQGRSVLTYGLESGEVRGSHLQFGEQSLSMQVDTPFGRAQVQAELLGRFNAYNLLAVLSTLLVADISLERAVDALSRIRPVIGRMQQIGGGKAPVAVIDYAHTPDALEKVLNTLREQTQGDLICVFGCGGERDAGKRPIMGEVASRLADRVIVTSDNPRSEDPAQIISAIVAGMHGDYRIDPDRAHAIAMAINAARPGDIVLVAGKGHESYQEIAGTRHPFSDQQVAAQILQLYQGGAA